MTIVRRLPAAASDDTFSEMGMANLPAARTHLPNEICVFISDQGGAKHGPRIKVSNTRGKMDKNDTFSVSVNTDPQVISGGGIPKGYHSYEIAAIAAWVLLNKDTLLSYWVGENQDTADVISKLKPLP